MNKLKLACLIARFILSLAIFGGLINQRTILAKEEIIELNAKYPLEKIYK